MTKDELQRYLKLPYRMNLTFDAESNAWVIRYPELPGGIAHGATPQRALIEGERAKALWLETALTSGHQILLPQGEPAHSGKSLR
jgi:predicted RNase H-like HicB family nuclease